MMRTFIFLMCTTVFCFNTENTFSQEKVIIEKDQLVAADHVFKIIKKQTKLNFVYPKGLFKNTPKIQLKKGEIEASKLIEKVLEKNQFNFELTENNTIIINEVKVVEEVAIQENEISGTILDQTGLPLPGVNILVEGTSIGTQSDFDGNYTIRAKKGDIIVFSYIGFQSEKITVSDAKTVNLVMKESTSTLEEVVVIGYGVQKKANLTAAVQMVDVKDLENRPVKSLTDMLSASVPGLNITTTSGAPNAESSLNIRGFTGFNASGSPLVLVDGIPQDMKLVNANDVESISVLKDAAASAIYGSRAPNGVILITTKSGRKGQKMQINFSSNLIINSPIGLPSPQDSDVDAIQRNYRRYNSQLSPLFSDEAIDRMTQYIAGEITTTNIIQSNGKYGGVYEYNANNNHYESAFRDNVFNQINNVSINGGSENTTYYASLGTIDNEGVYDSPYDWLKRHSALIKVNTDVTDWLSVGVSSKYGRQQSSRPTIWNKGQNDGAVFDGLAFIGSLPDYDDNGSPNEFSLVPSLNGLAGSYNNTNDDLWLSGQFELKPVSGLSFKGDYSWNVNHQFDTNTEMVFGSYDADGSPKPSRRSPAVDKITEKSNNKYYHNLNLVATYHLELGKHDFNLLAGYNEELNQFNSLTGSNSLFYTQTTPSLSTTYGDSPFTTDAINSWATRGYFGRLSYNYKETYLLDVNARYDASSKYSPDSRWAFFPSISAGYNMAKENFWPLKEAVSMFKIKGSWGKLGNNTGSNYAYLPTLGTASQTPVILDGGRLPYVTMPGIISTDLTWTKPRTIGFGLEVAAFNNRLKAEYDWYQKTIFDQLGPAEQYSEVLGTSAPQRNNAISETRGWEMTLSWRDKAFNLKGSPVNYSIRAGVSDYVGYVVDYEGNDTGLRNQWTPGQVFGELYGWTSSGIAQSTEEIQAAPLWRSGWFYPGDIGYADTNGDGLVTNGQGSYWYSQGDRKLLGYTYPRYKYNIALNASWKGFTISALFDGVGKQTAYSRRKFAVGTQNFASVENAERGYWSLNSQDAFFPRAYQKNLNNSYERYTNDQYAINLAHLRIKNVNLSYSLPSEILSKMKLRSLSLSFSAENLGMVFNKSWLKEYDPIQIAKDFQTYPPSRIFSIGLNVGI